MNKRSKRKPIMDLLNRDVEKPVLEALYIEHSVATDQLKRVPQTLREITNSFNRIASRDFEPSILLRYMINRRKAKDWPRLGTKARKFESVLNLLAAEELEMLRRIYVSLDVPSDDFLFQPDLMREVALRFEGLTNVRYEGTILVAVIVAKRKRGEWIRIREPFADIDVVGASGA